NIHYPEEKREEIREAGWEYGTYVCPLYEGDIDHGRVIRILAEAGYKGDVYIENESLRKWETAEERQKVLGREVAHLWEQIKSFG
ncbi:MAG: hypothetical protein IT364_01375, partial [Candidatus Hydrogenedentes bacterium]|nr:hypothetical protein [Candidatus Hydrogenedentota bacterium]